MKPNKIEPKDQSIYAWMDKQTDDVYEVVAVMPEGLKQEEISVKLNKANGNIIATIKEKLPFLAGKAFGAVTDITYHYQDQQIHIIFKKATKDPWPYLFKGQVNKNTPLDPNSCLQIFLVNAQQGIDSTNLLLQAVSTMFPPAVITFANCVQNSNQDMTDAIVLLRALVSEYKVATAATLLGHYGLLELIPPKEGLDYLKWADENGDQIAKLTLGYVYSPYEEPHGTWEDVDKAIEKFNEIKEHPRAQYGLGLIEYYHNNNKELGREMVRNARKELPNMPDIPEEQPKKEEIRKEPTPPAVSNKNNLETKAPEEKQQKVEKPASNGTKTGAMIAAGVSIAAFAALAFTYIRRKK